MNLTSGFHVAYAQQSGSVCDTVALPAFFEIDANLRSGTVNAASDDWFTGSSGTGIGIIGSTSATAYPGLPLSTADFKTLLQTAASPLQRNITYAQRMTGNLAAVRTTALGSVMLLEAVAGRDHFSSPTTIDSSSFLSGRNGDNPLQNWTVGSAVHTNDAEIIDAGVHYRRIKTGATTFGDCWGFGFVTNANGNGDGFYDFEFFQTGPVFNTSSGAVSMTGPDSTGGHTAFYFTADSGKIVQTGDVVLSLDQENGGLSQSISVRIWVNPSLLGPGITSFTQFNAKSGRQFEFTGLFDTGLNGNGYGYAEIRPRGTPTNCVFYASLNRSGSCRIPATPWGTIDGATGNYKDSLECYQYTECGINFSKFGLENVLLRLNCNYPSVSVVVKSRSSAQFTSNIKDYSGPYLMRNIVESNAGPDKQIICNSTTVALSGSSATPTPTISWSVVPGSGGHIVSGATTFSPVVDAAGKYVLSVGNILIAPCTATDTVEVSFNQTSPTVTLVSTDTLDCSTSSVTLTPAATPSSGNTISGYLWSPGGATTSSIAVTSAGSYAVTVTQSNGCSATASAVVVGESATVSANSTNAIDCDHSSSTLSATISSSTGVTATAYSWSPGGQTTASFLASTSGTYSVTVTFANGCTSSASVIVASDFSVPTVNASVSNSLDCNNTTANVSVSATPSSGNFITGYLWSSGQTTTGFTASAAGTYSVTVTQSNGCTASDSVVLSQASLLSASASSGSIACYGGSTTVTVSAAGGTPPYTGTGSFTRSAGTYTFTVTDAGGCSAVASVTVTSPAQIVVNSFTPVSGGAGTSVTISGAGFTGSTDVLFNGLSAASFTVLNDTQITAIVPVGATTGVITVQNGTCSGSSSGIFTTSITLQLKFYLQGYYLGGGWMSRPLYTLGITGDSTISDSAQVQLYSPSNLTVPAFTYTGRFHTNGTMSCSFSGSAASNSYYITVIHKNHLQAWSKTPVLLGATTTYDFTVAATQGYADQLVDQGDGSFAFYAGDFTDGATDGTQDGYVNGSDFSSMENLIPLGLSGTYEYGDLDGDGYVNGADYSLIQNNVPLGVTMARPF